MNPAMRRWTPEELKLIGKLPDSEVARKTNRLLSTVRIKRLALGIPHCVKRI